VLRQYFLQWSHKATHEKAPRLMNVCIGSLPEVFVILDLTVRETHLYKYCSLVGNVMNHVVVIFHMKLPSPDGGLFVPRDSTLQNCPKRTIVLSVVDFATDVIDILQDTGEYQQFVYIGHRGHSSLDIPIQWCVPASSDFSSLFFQARTNNYIKGTQEVVKASMISFRHSSLRIYGCSCR
jgi:hypothetical protein